MTSKWPSYVKEIDNHYNSGLSDWEKRHQKLFIRDRYARKALHISVSQLFRSHQLGHADALTILDKVIACTSARPCFQILCPACRIKRQQDTGAKAVAEFSGYPGANLKFWNHAIS